MNNIKSYTNLTGLLLGPIRQRPGMYLGENKISKLTNFLTGYHMGQVMNTPDAEIDPYFGENGFLSWFHTKYNIKMNSSWASPFLVEADNDEAKALDIFFNYLEEYSTETTKH